MPKDFGTGAAARAAFDSHVDLGGRKTPHELEFTEWYGTNRSVDDEAALVRRSYEATWRRKRVAVVLGHETLYWYEGALKAEESVALVRIRRVRYETADSWRASYEYGAAASGAAKPTRSGPGWFWFAPWLNCARVVLRLPEGNGTSEAASCDASDARDALWRTRLVAFQRALWFVDEVEARWQLLKRSDPAVAALVEVDWGKTDPDSLRRVAAAIADLIGLEPTLSEKRKKHRQGPPEAQFSETREARSLDLDYRALMRFSPRQVDLLRVVHDESDAKWPHAAVVRPQRDPAPHREREEARHSP